MYGHLSRMSTLAHDRGMFLSANFNADEARTLGFLGADRIDYFGLEQGLVDRATEEVSLDQFAMVKRTMAHQRPISTLDHKIGRGELGDHEIDRRLQQNLFYGMFAGAFNAPVEADGGSGVSTWTAGDAPRVWARYTPIIRRLATAGWEPVTFARSSNPAVWVERFGSLADGDLVLTLRNETGQDQPFTLTLNLAALGLREPGPISAVELVSGGARRLVVDSAGTGASISATIPRHSTFAVAVRPAP